jgi:hypothetical protein
MHVHVESPEGEAKFWIEPIVALSDHHGLSGKQLSDIQKVIEERNIEITKAWKKHFSD